MSTVSVSEKNSNTSNLVELVVFSIKYGEGRTLIIMVDVMQSKAIGELNVA